MNLLRGLGWRRLILVLAAAWLLMAAAIQRFSDDPEISLTIGEPWEAMRKRSTAAIAPAIPGHYWGRSPKSDARLRFIDEQYGFVTPLARFLTVSFDDEKIGNVHMSPQVEPLLLEDTLKVVLDLQEQWLLGGWIAIRPPIDDTPLWRERLRDVRKGGTTYWQAGNQYQAMLEVDRFLDDRHPDEERYLITLQVARPWVKP